jgi:hypothetical protein
MFELVVGFVVGLVVGWNFLSQPEFIKDWISGWFSKED